MRRPPAGPTEARGQRGTGLLEARAWYSYKPLLHITARFRQASEINYKNNNASSFFLFFFFFVMRSMGKRVYSWMGGSTVCISYHTNGHNVIGGLYCSFVSPLLLLWLLFADEVLEFQCLRDT